MAPAKVNKKAKPVPIVETATATPPKKSSRLAEQAAKRKAADDVSPATAKKRKAVEEKPVSAAPVTKTKTAAAAKTAKTKKAEKPKKALSKPAATKVAAAAAVKAEKKPEEANGEDEEADDAEEDDDATTALVQAIDSSKDDADEDDEPAGGVSLFQPGQDVGKAPAAAVNEAVSAQAKKNKSSSKNEGGRKEDGGDGEAPPLGGVVYVGRIPHGFFEHEMRSYFSQFGDIRRLRLSRNRHTGASKHYAFIEFSDRDVADIVAKTMDNYLLFGHLLRCSVVSPDRIPANLFRGANRRFKTVPWNRLAGTRLALPRSEAGWADKIGREAKKRAARAAQVAGALGYTYEPPQLKKASAVTATDSIAAVEEAKPEQPAFVEEAPTAAAAEEPVEDAVVAKAGKGKKGKKGKAGKA